MKQGFLASGNMNVRLCDNAAVFVQYNQAGKAKEVAFIGWTEFLTWLTQQVEQNEGETK